MIEMSLGGKHQYFPLVDKVSFEGISLSIEESVIHKTVTGMYVVTTSTLAISYGCCET